MNLGTEMSHSRSWCSQLSGCKKHLTRAMRSRSRRRRSCSRTISGTSTWIVGPDGAVSAVLKDPSGNPIKGTVTGQMTFQNPDGTPQSVPVQYDSSNGVVTAPGRSSRRTSRPSTTRSPSTENRGRDRSRFRSNGTQELADNAKLNAATPPPSVGPHGGVVQMVGPDRVEVVANKGNGEVRAYVLDPSTNQPIDPGDRRSRSRCKAINPRRSCSRPIRRRTSSSVTCARASIRSTSRSS